MSRRVDETHRHGRDRFRAFPLVEWLVVIGIIAVPVSLLLPALTGRGLVNFVCAGGNIESRPWDEVQQADMVNFTETYSRPNGWNWLGPK